MEMENVRIAVLSSHDKVCTFLDNDASGAMHYYDDELHEYLKGTANTCTFKSDAKHEDSIHLIEGNKLSFRYKKKDYYLNIMSVRRDENVVEITAYSLNFELLNEQKGPYKAANAMSFAQYMDVFDYEKVVTLGINEVSSKSIKNEWTGTETMLARLFSLSNIFDAEIELIPQLNDDYSLKEITLNVYQAHTDTMQGVGTDRTDIVLRFGKNISGVTKTSDVTELYTLVYPFGKEGLTVASLDKTEYDAEGRIEYRSPAGDRNIYAVIARDRFPSNATSQVNNRYIAQQWNYDTDNINVLYSQALAQLKKNCVPQVKYEVEGYFDTGIGDTVTIADDEFNPPLYLQARVTEQTRSFTDPSRNKTTFDNFKELQNEIDPSLLSAVSALIEANKTYTCSIISNNGIIFKNGQGSTTLTASIMDGGKDMTDSLTIRWEKDGTALFTGKSITVNASDISAKAVYRYEAVDAAEIVRGVYEVTVSDLEDGKTQYLHIKYSDDGGKTFTGNNGEDSGKWMGYYVDFTQADSESPNMYSWVKVEGPQGEQGTQGPKGEKGDSGGKGDKGDPMGILELSTEPPTKYEGMLWKHSGTVPGFIHNSIYRWTGLSWTLFKFRADNIEADSFKGYEFDGAVFKSAFDFTDSDEYRVVGTAQMSDGKINIDSVKSRNLGGDTITQLMVAVLGYNGISISSSGRLYGQHETKVTDRSIEFSNSLMKTMLYDNGLSIQSTDPNPSLSVIAPGGIKLIDSSGSANIDPATFNGKAPTNHASSGTGYGVGTTANYGHVKTRNDLNASSYVAGETLSSYQGYLLNNKITALCSGVVTKGRVNVTASSTNWLNVTGIPGYNANNRYYAIVNNPTVPLSAFVRNDGRLIVWGPNVFSGTTYTVDYLVFIS